MKQKKILLLGGLRYLLPVIKTAKEMGLYVITCDYLPDNYAHRYADEYAYASVIDKEAVLEVARSNRVDGIISFACDAGVTSAAYAAEKLGLPSVGSYESVSILQNKCKFREFLRTNGFAVPRALGFRSKNEMKDCADQLSFPFIVKPADCAGSKGVTIVDNQRELSMAVESALGFSHSGEFILEEYIESVGCSSDSDCFLVDGVFKYVSFSDQLFDKSAVNPFTPAGYNWPAAMEAAHQENLVSELNRLAELLKLKTSIFNVETRIGSDGKCYIMEAAPRGGGNRIAEIIKYGTGLDLIGSVLRTAIGENPSSIEQCGFKGCWSEIILHANSAGAFKELFISDALKSFVVETDLWVSPGDAVNAFTGANQTVGTVVLRFDSHDRQLDVMNNIQDYVRVVVS